MLAELLKVRSTLSGRSLLTVLVLGGAAVLAAAAAAPSLLQGLIALQHRYPHLNLTDAADGGFDDLLTMLRIEDASYQRSLVDLVNPGPFAGFGSLGLTTTCALLTGVLVATADFRHGGFVLSALATPDRRRVVARKAGAVVVLVAGAGTGLVLASGAALLTAVVATPGAELELAATQIVAVWVRSILVLVAMGLIGLGIGLIVRRQTPAVAAVLVASVVEPTVVLVTLLLSGSVPWPVAALPLSASQLAPRGSTFASSMDLGATLPPLLALTALAVWALLHLAIGTWRTERSDLV